MQVSRWWFAGMVTVGTALIAINPLIAKADQTSERTVTRGGKPVTLFGPELKVGDQAPEFVATNNDFKSVGLKDYAGKIKVISAVSSLDTSICSTETRKFNELAAGMGDDVIILTISMDLPYAQRRWCGANGAERITALSDYKDHSFGMNYGLLTTDLLLLARAVLVIDQQNAIRYIQRVPEIRQEPDYDDVLRAIKEIRTAAPSSAKAARTTESAALPSSR